MPVTLRYATHSDIPALGRLIEQSARALSVGYYTPAQIDAAVRYVFGVDSALLADGTYYAAVDGDAIVGCGGWSLRRTLYGGDQRPVGSADFLDPLSDAARIRAFFVAPAHARRGIGRMLVDVCARAAEKAGFRRLELMATLSGVPLYEACGFRETGRTTDACPTGPPSSLSGWSDRSGDDCRVSAVRDMLLACVGPPHRVPRGGASIAAMQGAAPSC